MCGIGLLLSISEHSNHSRDVNGWNDLLEDALSSRGPDISRRSYQYNTCDANLTLHSSVLHMRGDMPTAQPLLFSLGQSFSDDIIADEHEPQAEQHDCDCAFCWNGECYTYAVDSVEELSDKTDNEFVQYVAMNELVANANSQEIMVSKGDLQSHQCNQSDTELVKNLLLQAISSTRQHIDKTSSSNDLAHLQHKTVAMTMSRIHGEYSFLLYTPLQTSLQGHEGHGCVYFGRDMLGRRSLLINRSIHGLVLISSVATKLEDKSDATSSWNDAFNTKWEELPPGIVYRLDISTGEVTSISIPRTVNRALQSPALINNTLDDAAVQLLQLLDQSIQRRVKDAPSPKSQCQSDASVAILFSGGIDSVILAALSDRHVSSDRPIDLINVSFFDDSDSNSSVVSPDRLAALISFVELREKWPKRNWRFIAADISYQEVLTVESRVLRLINPLNSTMDFNIAVAFWFAGRGKGWLIDDKYANDLINSTKNGQFGQKAESQEPMLRFATYGDSISSKGCQFSSSSKKDRQRSVCIREGCNRPAPASDCLFNACKFCCGKLSSPIYKFVGQRVQICPAHNRNANNTNTHTATLSRAKIVESCGKKLPITSNAKILISGVGADEQMAGYGRHRTTFQRGGYDELKTELEMEIGRLWTRNLGRDDRCLSDFGKEARFPYLDDDVVAYLAELPMQLKCDLRLSQGEGDKMILRKVAILLGLNQCSGLVKRAIQFGSRIAKVSDKNRYGSQRQATGRAKHVRG